MTSKPRLIDPELLRERCRLFALIDAIVAPESCSFEFHPKWRRGEALGVFKNGQGDFVFLWFSSRGCVVRGFDHESKISPYRFDPPELWPGLFDGFPSALSYALREPAFDQESVTFCLWHSAGSDWQRGKVRFPRGAGRDPDGSKALLEPFAPNYARWAAGYYGRKLDSQALDQLWWGNSLDRAIVFGLNPDADARAVTKTAQELRWPVAEKLTAPRARRAAKRPAAAAPARGAKRRKSFGAAEFVVRCEPTVVKMLIGDGKVVTSVKADIYGPLFDLVKQRILEERRQLRKGSRKAGRS